MERYPKGHADHVPKLAKVCGASWAARRGNVAVLLLSGGWRSIIQMNDDSNDDEGDAEPFA